MKQVLRHLVEMQNILLYSEGYFNNYYKTHNLYIYIRGIKVSYYDIITENTN